MLNSKMKPIALAVGAAFATSLAAGVAVADEADVNPFEVQVLAEGTLLADAHKEGGCGEDKAEGDSEGSCGEGKCGDAEGGESEGDEPAEDTEEPAAPEA